jgi:DNA polymerase-1
MHTVLKTTRVGTGRLSSSKDDNGEGANLQNIPTRNKEAKAIKNGFIAPDGKILIEADYSQVEMRCQAHLAKCKGLIELFNRGGDPHAETAAKFFGVSLEVAKKDKYRYPCKRGGFGIIYLISGEGLSSQINEYIADLEMEGEPVEVEPWDVQAAKKFIADYYRMYPEIRDYQQEQLAHARRFGYVQDMFGRIRYIPEVACPIRSIQETGARMAANMPVTASAQGIIKAAMGKLWRDLPQTKWAKDVLWEMQIHDSLIVEVSEDKAVYKPYLKWMKDVMCNVVHMLVPVGVDFKVGKKWGELEKV